MIEDKDDLLGSIVAVDETSLGGKQRKKGQTSKRELDDAQPKGRSGTRKRMVTVAAERGGRVKAEKGKTHSEGTIAAFVLKKLDRLGTVLVTDELPAFAGLGANSRRIFASITRLANTSGTMRTLRQQRTSTPLKASTPRASAPSSAWGIGFRSSPPRRYLHEVCFRRNWRGQNTDARLASLFAERAGRLRWKELVA
jgi:ISXO2-like transposase domain